MEQLCGTQQELPPFTEPWKPAVFGKKVGGSTGSTASDQISDLSLAAQPWWGIMGFFSLSLSSRSLIDSFSYSD